MPTVDINTILPESRDLERLVADHDPQHTERLARQVSNAREKTLRVLRPRTGGDVVVLGLGAEQMIAHAAAGEVGDVTGGLELLNDIDGPRVHCSKIGSTSSIFGGGVWVS